MRINPRFRAAQSVAHMLARREGKAVTQALSIANHQLSLWGTACYDVGAHDVHLCNMMLISHALLIGAGEMVQQSPRAFSTASHHHHVCPNLILSSPFQVCIGGAPQVESFPALLLCRRRLGRADSVCFSDNLATDSERSIVVSRQAK